MKIAIRGCKDINDKVYQIIKNSERLEIVYVIDINAQLWGNFFDNIEIVSPMKGKLMYDQGKIDKVFLNPYIGAEGVASIYDEMRKIGFKDVDICCPSVYILNKMNAFDLKGIEAGEYRYKNFKQLYYLEFHIADECNLKCKGCSHFSSLVEEPSHPSIELVERDLTQLRKIIDHIEWIRILGGEPFLNEKWLEYLKIVRQMWPYSKLSIVTNGLLLNRITDSEIKTLKKLNVWIDISLYKPLWNKVDDIIKNLKEKNVKYEVNGMPVFEFTTCFDMNSQDDFVQKRNECHTPCVNLYNGKVTPCPIMMYVDRFNKYFNTSLPEGEPIDIYNMIDYENFISALNKAMPICRYCNQKESYAWEMYNQKDKCEMDHWITGNSR